MISKKSQTVLVFFLILFIAPLVSAVETSISVETLPGHHITLNILNAKTDNLYKSLEGNASTSGIATFTYTASSTQEINIYAIIRNESGKIVLTKQFTSMTTGNEINLKVIDETKKPATSSPPTPNLTATNNTPQNNTPQNNTPANLTVNTTAKNDTNVKSNAVSPNSGSAMSDFWKNISDYKYTILTIVIIIALVLLIYWFWPSISTKFKSIKPAPSAKAKDDFDAGASKELIHAEKKLKQLEEEIYRIKNKNKRITEAEKKFEDAKRELDRVKRE